MATNKILPWAQTGTANVLSDDAYAADVATGGLYGDGVKAGQASSQQANKTWRQATAPGSGLGQFLVDNLNVDVTDADTPATFSTRIANAILKLAQISPFNQSFAAAIGGYRKYAIVSDSSGNFWVSTADQNVTVPGDSGAKWQSLFNGYATQTWANRAFVKNNNGSGGGIVSADMDASGVPSFQSGNGTWYPVQLKGDYATNPALNTEITNRTNADTNLQNQINTKASLSGATFTGTVSVGYGSGWGGSSSLRWGNGALWFGNPDNSASAVFEGLFQITDVVGDANNDKSGINIGGYNFAGTRFDWYLAWNGNITTPKGLVAFQSDLTAESTARTNADNNLQNQINGKLDSSFVASGLFDGSQGSTTSGTIVGGTWMRVGNTLTQHLVIENIGGGTVTYPIPFSGNTNQVVVIVQDGTGSNNSFTTGDIQLTHVGIHAAGGGGTGRLHLTVSGPYGT